MHIKTFLTEQFFDQYEFSVKYQICNSDCEALTIGELLSIAGSSFDELAALDLGYCEASGSQQLRSLIAKRYAGITAEDVVVLGSPVEGIFLVASATLEKGDEVIVVTPAYDALLNAFEFVVGQGNVRPWKIQKRDGQWHLDLNELHGLLSDKTRLVVVNFPHNPTGFLPSEDFQKAICDQVRNSGARLFCDEMYFGLVNYPAEPVPPINEVMPDAISLCGLSKTYGMPGLRCGWLVVNDVALREKIVNWKHYTSLCPSATTQYLATLAMRVLPKIKRRNQTIVDANIRLAEAFFEQHGQSFRWNRPSGGSTALVEYFGGSVTELADKLAKEAGVLILPTLGLRMDDAHFRIGLGRRNFADGLAKLDQWLAQS